MKNVLVWSKGLRGRLLLLGVIPLLALGFTGAVAKKTVDELRGKLDFAYNVRAQLIRNAGKMAGSVHAIGRWVWIIYGNGGNVQLREKFIKQARLELEDFEKTKSAYVGLPRAESVKALFSGVEESWPTTRDGVNEALAHFSLHTPEENEAAKKVLQAKVLPNLVPMSKTFDDIEVKMDEILKAEIEATGLQVRRAEGTLLAFILFCGAGMLLLSAFLASRLVKTLAGISYRLVESSRQVRSASNQIASSSEELSRCATEQASSLEETAASLEQIAAMIAKASDGASNTATSSAAAQGKAGEGSGAVNQMIHSMAEISQSNDAIMNQVTQSNQKMSEIVSVIQNIGQKTNVINDIVFQTKLLSFNASVEAARAGEHGKGFAVVAEEVGNLAQMSGSAAKEITEMLESSISRVESIVSETKRSVEGLIVQGKQKVEMGVDTAKKCAEVFDEIVKGVSVVSSLAQEISSASKEQSQGVGEINKAMTMLNSVTQKNAAASEETAAAAEELSAQADSLNGVVCDLVCAIDGGAKTKSEGGLGPAKGAKLGPAETVDPDVDSVPPASKPLELQHPDHRKIA